MLVATWVAPTGNVREREHLVIRFADGAVLRVGRRDDVAAGFWAAAASLAAERSGRAIRRVERED